MAQVHSDNTEKVHQKVYSGIRTEKIHKSNAYGDKNVSFLPPMAGNHQQDHDSHSRASSYSSAGANKQKTTYLINQLQSEAVTANLDRLRMLVREKEIEVTKLKAESSTLRKRERKYQKDIEHLEQTNREAPKLIQRLREDLTISKVTIFNKNKLKTYYVQIGEDSRVIRQIHDERNKLREQNQKLEELVIAKDLAERNDLQLQLEQSNRNLKDLQKLYIVFAFNTTGK